MVVGCIVTETGENCAVLDGVLSQNYDSFNLVDAEVPIREIEDLFIETKKENFTLSSQKSQMVS